MPDFRDECFGRRPEQERKKRAKRYEFLRPKPETTVRGVSLSSRVLIAYSHWENGISFPCVTAEKGCVWCNRAKPSPARMRGFLCGLDYSTGKQCVIEVTKNALEANHVLTDERTDLRGMMIVTSRRGKDVNSPCVTVIERSPHLPQSWLPLPQPFDLIAAVLRIWSDPNSLQDFADFEPTQAMREATRFARPINQENGK